MKKIFFLSLITLFAFNMQAFVSNSSKLGRIFSMMYKNMENTDINLPTMQNSMKMAVNLFANIEKNFSKHAFSWDQEICDSFKTLSSNIEKLYKQENIKPWNIRELAKNILGLVDATANVAIHAANRDERELAILIFRFSDQMTKHILMHTALHTGSAPERFLDKFLYKPGEFLLQNGKIAIPASIILTKVLWDAWGLSRAPSEIGKPIIQTNSGGIFSWLKRHYRKIPMCLAGLLLVNFAESDGFVKDANTGCYYSQPLQDEVSIPVKKEKANTKKKKQVIKKCVVEAAPSLNQVSRGPCGYHAIYNVCCMMNNNNPLNRTQFEAKYKEWQWVLNKERIKNMYRQVPTTDNNLANASQAWFNAKKNDIKQVVQNNPDSWVSHIFENFCEEMKSNNIKNFDTMLNTEIDLHILNKLVSKIKQRYGEADGVKNAFSKTYNPIRDALQAGTETFDNSFAALKELKIGDYQIKSIIEAIPKNINTREKRKQLFVANKFKGLPDENEINNLIKNGVPALCKKNNSELKNNVGIFAYNSGVDILRQNAIANFKNSGGPLYLVAFTGGGNHEAEKSNKKTIDDHIIAIKVEKINRGKLKISIADSYRGYDNRYTWLVEQVYRECSG